MGKGFANYIPASFMSGGKHTGGGSVLRGRPLRGIITGNVTTAGDGIILRGRPVRRLCEDIFVWGEDDDDAIFTLLLFITVSMLQSLMQEFSFSEVFVAAIRGDRVVECSRDCDPVSGTKPQLILLIPSSS